MTDTTGAVEYRHAAVEVRGEADAPRLYLRAIATGEQAGDRLEVFDALPTQPEGGVLVGRLHPASKAPVLRAQLDERDGALILDVELPATQAGREIAIEVRNKTLPMASIEFRALADRVGGGVRRISKSIVEAVSLVPAGSYPSATAEVRRRRRRRARW